MLRGLIDVGQSSIRRWGRKSDARQVEGGRSTTEQGRAVTNPRMSA